MRRRVIVNDRMQKGYIYAAIRQHCEKGDVDCRRRQRQAVHWAYGSRRI